MPPLDGQKSKPVKQAWGAKDSTNQSEIARTEVDSILGDKKPAGMMFSRVEAGREIDNYEQRSHNLEIQTSSINGG